MKIVIGLGNPGRKYRSTPHNVGFEVLDSLAKRWGAEFASARREEAEIAEARRGAETVLLVKPQTYMNLSGRSAAEILRNRPAERADVFVVVDDTNLPLGRLRIRDGGTAGGHNGLKSLIERLGGDDFPRLRVGVQPERPIDDRSAYVLSPPPPEDRTRLEIMREVAADAVELWLEQGIEAAAGKFNGWREPAG